MVSDTNMWINVGQSQLHLLTGKPQVLRGHTALVIPGRETLLNQPAPGGAEAQWGREFSHKRA